MNQSSNCHLCLNHQYPTSSSAGSESRTMTVQGQLRNSHQRSTDTTFKVKRRKTKKERNNAKFKKCQAERVLTQVSNSSFMCRKEIDPRHNCLRVVPPSSLRGACNSKPVIITQSRLSHHQGMFKREVKSINIGRLLNQEIEKGIAREAYHDSRAQLEESNIWQENIIPTPNYVEEPELKAQEKVASAEPKGANLDIQNTEPVSGNAPDADKDNFMWCSLAADDHPPKTLHSSMDIQSPSRQTAPVLEVAENILRILNSHALFPGRNLVSETQKSIMANVLQHHNSCTTLSALSVQRKLDYSDRGDTDIFQDSDHQHRNSENTKTRHGPQTTKKKLQTSPAQIIFKCAESPFHTVIKNVKYEHRQDEITDIFNQPEVYQPENSQGSRKHHLRFAEDHLPKCNYLSPKDHPELVWDSRSRLQRSTEAFRHAMRQSKSHKQVVLCSPNHRNKCVHNECQNPLPYSKFFSQYNIKQSISPMQCETQEQEHTINSPLQEILPDQTTLEGLRIRHRAALENQTSFDVLKSIWHCDIHKSPNYKNADLCLEVSPQGSRLCYRELSPQKTQSEGYCLNCCRLSAHKVVPELSIDSESLHFGDTSQIKVVENGNVRKMQRHKTEADTRLYGVTFSPSNLSRHKYLSEPCHSNVRSPVSASRRNPLPKCSIENRNDDLSYITKYSDFHGQCRQLTTSVFPPSDYLEQENSIITFPYRGLLKQSILDKSSPEAWVFPRMKLY